MLHTLLKMVFSILSFFIKVGLLILPSVLVYSVLMTPEIQLHRGVPLIGVADPTPVNSLFPHTRWSDLKPCGEFFNEQEELEIALSCVNNKVWTESPLKEVLLPRCFVISANSPDVYSIDDTHNFIPIVTIFGISGIVGLYDSDTRTLFVVESIDIRAIYRHELQHYFLHLHDPETSGGGHYQEIWEKCEPPYYTPSIESQMIAIIKKNFKVKPAKKF